MNKGKTLYLSVISLGISSIVVQLVLMREFLSVFYGNELVFGIVLGNWLLITGIGSYLGKYSGRIKKKLELLIFSQVLVAVMPFVSIFLIRSLRIYFFIPGQALGLEGIFASSFLILLPYCLISGAFLTVVCSLISGRKGIGEVYFVDSIGDMLGGFLFSFVLVFFLNSFQMVFLVMVLNIVSATLLSWKAGKGFPLIFILTVFVTSCILFFSYDLELISAGFLFPDQNLVHLEDSPYGKIAVTETLGQFNFFENGLILFSTGDVISREETVHYAMVQHPNPKRVLLISGGVSGTVSEILKYNPERIDYVELDPGIIRIGRKYTEVLEDERINIITQDGRFFVKNTPERYDVVIIDLPDPETIQINRFYSLEFFRELKGVLREGGVVSLSLTSSENYISPEIERLNSMIYHTLLGFFRNVIVIPGDRNYFVASDSDLDYNISEKIRERGIETRYVNEDYLSGKITEERIGYLMRLLKKGKEVNRDFMPLACYYHEVLWMSQFGESLLPVLLILLVLVMLFIIRTKPVPLSIFTTGFAASGLEVVLLIGFQILYGYVYLNIGIIFTAFMLGLVVGSFYMNRNPKGSRRNLMEMDLMIFSYSLILPVIFACLSAFRERFLIFFSSQIIFPFLAFLIAVLVGMEFPLASRIYKEGIEHTAGVLYFSDLFGAFLGAVLVGAFLIPILGVFNVCILIGLLNLFSGLMVGFRRS
ncbi:MAG TPA: hypothetical protein ENG00_01085 [Candidatus Aenigmarchaeota archaeon]|nr:hypothetical protein [Candidatus Aenigmarchaeota archaeon]